MSDDTLGQQQDDIARLRYELSKELETDSDIGGTSPVDVFQSLVERGEVDLVRSELASSLKRLNSEFDSGPWVEKLIQSLQVKNRSEFERLHRQAILAATTLT